MKINVRSAFERRREAVRKMKESRFADEQEIAIIEEANRGELTVEELCRKHGIHKQTYYGAQEVWRAGRESDLQRLRALEQENARLKKALAEALLDVKILRS